MLETKIEELIKALERNSDIMERIHAGEHRLMDVPEETHGGLTHEEYQNARLPPVSNPEVPNENSKPATSTSEPSSSESPPVTYDDVKRATNAVSKISRDKAVTGLARFGVMSATKLPERSWAEYIGYMTRVAAGEIDPEASQ
jgi:hypothetical protein